MNQPLEAQAILIVTVICQPNKSAAESSFDLDCVERHPSPSRRMKTERDSQVERSQHGEEIKLLKRQREEDQELVKIGKRYEKEYKEIQIWEKYKKECRQKEEEQKQ